MAFRNKARVYLALSILVLAVVYSSQQPHGHAHEHEHGHGHAHHGHGHGHGHHGHGHEEKPSFKYSREANEAHGHAHDDHGHSHDHHGHHHSHEQPKKRDTDSIPSSTKSAPRDRFTIALHAMTSTGLISVAPFLILFFIPLNDNKVENQALLKILLAFASGSLLGDAFLHLIPHALDPHDHSQSSHSHSHSHSHADSHDHSHQTNVGLWVMAGILTFLMVEKLIVSINGGDHAHSHSQPTKKEKESDSEEETKPKEAAKIRGRKKMEKTKPKEKEDSKHEGIKVAGYLNLAADFAHNFTDGLAIGASFLAGQNLGIITTFTILFHEVPHEIGDFAILIQSGCSKKKAIFLQLVTALGAISGTLLSLVFESTMSGFATACILPFTAGGFIYIATVTIIPELKENSSFFQSVKEILALVAGVVMMVVISYIE